MKKIITIIIIFYYASIIAQTKFDISSIKICNQIWTAKNLDVSTYSDGTPIPQIKNSEEWSGLKTGAWCYYNNDPENGESYGKLYNWYAVAGIYDDTSASNPELRKKLAPKGWHIPTENEWEILNKCLGYSDASSKMKETGNKHWVITEYTIKSTNSSGFTAIPGGFRDNNRFYSLGRTGYWWSLPEDKTEENNRAMCFVLDYYFPTQEIYYGMKINSYSVRCVKD